MLRLCEVKDFMMRIKYVSNITYNEEELSRLINMTILHLNNLNKQINKIHYCPVKAGKSVFEIVET